MKKPIQVIVRLSPDLHRRVEDARGNVPREPWIRRAIERELRDPEPSETEPILASERVVPRPRWE
jgi:hypothetical protein